jgi:hypothetical protein
MKTMILLFMLVGADAQDARVEYARQVSSMNTFFWKERLSLANWAKSRGLHSEARAHFEFMLKNISGTHPYKTRARKSLRGSWSKKEDSASEAVRREYRNKLQRYFTGTADRCFRAYEIAKRGGLANEARASLSKTVQFYTDHEKARKARGEVKVEAFGWVSEADAAMIGRNLFRVGERSLDGLQLKDKEHSTWNNAWVVRSEHFFIRTDLPIRTAVEALELLEDFYKGMKSWLGEGFELPKRPMGLYLFCHSQDLERVRRDLPGAPSSTAFYHGLTNLV